MLVRLFIFAITLYATSGLAASSPNIIVSIKPFYNITAKVMQSVGTPHLLLTKNASPHDYQLKPSDARLIDSANLVIWGGPALEGYLDKAVSSLANKNLDLSEVPGLEILPMRNSTNWQHEGHGHDHSHEDIDPHFWLDPDNAIIIATSIAMRLGEIDPKNARAYNENAKDFAKQINQQKKIWQKTLSPYRHDPYIVSHDAYQYFDKFFGLDGVGAISLHPEIPPSIQRIKQIQKTLARQGVRCIFTEPQFNFKIIDTLIAGTKVHKGQLDPLGQDDDLGPNGYEALVNNLITNFVSCNNR